MAYKDWVAAAISPLTAFIDMRINPRDYYLDLQEIAEGRGGTTLYFARLAETQRERILLPSHVRERDHHDLLARRPTFVAIKSVPILQGGSVKFLEVVRELRTMRDIRCEHILEVEALYIDRVEDALWIRMELMTRTLSSVIELNSAGLVLWDRMIAGCTKDILTALEHLRVNDIAPRNIRADNVLINDHGVLKLTNLSHAVKLSTTSGNLIEGSPSRSTEVERLMSATRLTIISDASALGTLVWEMAAGKRPPLNTVNRLEDWPPLSSITSRTPPFHEFIRMCLEPTVGHFGYRRLLDSPFIRDACERSTLLQLLGQCTAFERLREQRRAR
ncbi:kinase-like domain-containing protein [Mycena vulgaris]|nr:kinase-like domain-containing protein [Mycena vulgaris]